MFWQDMSPNQHNHGAIYQPHLIDSLFEFLNVIRQRAKGNITFAKCNFLNLHEFIH